MKRDVSDFSKRVKRPNNNILHVFKATGILDDPPNYGRNENMHELASPVLQKNFCPRWVSPNIIVWHFVHLKLKV